MSRASWWKIIRLKYEVFFQVPIIYCIFIAKQEIELLLTSEMKIALLLVQIKSNIYFKKSHCF